MDAFAGYLARLPAPRREAWEDLLSGGASSEAFGPLTLQEQLDESKVEEALQAGRRQQTINLALMAAGATAVLALVVAAVVVLWSDDGRTEGALRFSETEEDPEVAAVRGGEPVAEPELTAVLSTPLAVAVGAGEPQDRVVSAPNNDHRYVPGDIAASLFQFAASGHVAVVGPEGFVDDVCLRASVVTEDLRPLDTVTFGSCADPVGRTPVVGCIGPGAVLLDLRIPEGEVELPEGGSGFADAVRIQSITDDRTGYEQLSVRGEIGVAVDDDVTVPRFGGEVGETVTFDLDGERSGSCSITGDLPE